MNSLQKNVETKIVATHETFIATFEKQLHEMLNFLEVEILMKKLQFLGNHFDPFQGTIENECEVIMDQLGLTEHMKNPYLATNILLRLLDKTEERINKLKQ